MLECPGCNRHFGSLEQLRKHLRGCQDGMRAPSASEILGGPAERALKRAMTMPSSLGFTCCYCGRNFGSASLRIHQQQCVRDLEHRNALLPKSLQCIVLPEAPECVNCNIEEHNQQALQLYQEHVMLKCPGCDRRFAELSQLKKHLGGCPQSRGTAMYDEIMLDAGRAAVRRSMLSPRSAESLGFTCCFCGMEFGSQSLRIHQRSCRERWLRQDAALPRGLRRGSLPEPPELDTAKKQEHNAKARELYMLQSMFPCTRCDRRFSAPDALRKHMVSCRGASTPGGRRNSGGVCSPCHDSGMATPDTEAFESPVKERRSLGFTCCICGQDYGSKSLAIHQRQCRERWSRENADLPKHLQRSGPPEPPELTDPSQREEHNAQAAALYREQVMLPCRTCDRRFGTYEMLQQHESSCGKQAHLSRLRSKRAFTAPNLEVSAFAGTNASPRRQTTPRGPRPSLLKRLTASGMSQRRSLPMGLSPRNLFRAPHSPGSPSSGAADHTATLEEDSIEPVLSYTSRLRLAAR